MNTAPTRSVRAIITSLVSIVAVSVGCTAEPAVDDAPETPASAPTLNESDDADPAGQDDAGPAHTDPADTDPADSGEQPSTPHPTPTSGTTQPSAPAVPPAANETSGRPPAEPVATPTVIADGHHAGRVVAITTSHVTVHLVRVLTGDEAVAAAKADGGGALADDGSLPNDVYIQDLTRTVTMPVDGEGGVRIIDCTSGCQLVGTTLRALANGEAVPYGGPNAVVNLTVDEGAIVALEEQYLP